MIVNSSAGWERADRIPGIHSCWDEQKPPEQISVSSCDEFNSHTNMCCRLFGSSSEESPNNTTVIETSTEVSMTEDEDLYENQRIQDIEESLEEILQHDRDHDSTTCNGSKSEDANSSWIDML